VIILLVTLILLCLVVLATAWIRSRKRMWLDALIENHLNEDE
jgi:hypothetical protein